MEFKEKEAEEKLVAIFIAEFEKNNMRRNSHQEKLSVLVNL